MRRSTDVPVARRARSLQGRLPAPSADSCRADSSCPSVFVGYTRLVVHSSRWRTVRVVRLELRGIVDAENEESVYCVQPPRPTRITLYAVAVAPSTHGLFS